MLVSELWLLLVFPLFVLLQQFMNLLLAHFPIGFQNLPAALYLTRAVNLVLRVEYIGNVLLLGFLVLLNQIFIPILIFLLIIILDDVLVVVFEDLHISVLLLYLLYG